jgi:hypothetical protein
MEIPNIQHHDTIIWQLISMTNKQMIRANISDNPTYSVDVHQRSFCTLIRSIDPNDWQPSFRHIVIQIDHLDG